jgi:hypothetical protein
MFKYISRKTTKLVNHKRNQERIYTTIVRTRKVNKAVKAHSARIVEETQQTWTDAMNADI